MEGLKIIGGCLAIAGTVGAMGGALVGAGHIVVKAAEALTRALGWQ